MKRPLPQHVIKSLFVFGLLLAGYFSHAQIAVWNYEPLQGATATPTPNTGTGTSAIINGGGGTITPMVRTGMAGSGCGNQNGVNAWAFEPFDPGSANEASGAQFRTSTTNYKDIIFTWDQRWSNTAPNTARLQYTINGSTWTNFMMTGANTTYCNGSINTNGCFETNASGDQYRRISVNLSAITGVNNNPNFGVRVMAAHYQSTGQFRQCAAPGSVAGTAGTWRFDNVTVTGTLMPGPNPSVMSGTASTCAGTAVNISVAITGGTSPYTLVYTDGTSNFTVNNYTSATPISVNPASTRTYSIVSVTDANGLLGTGNSGSAIITVNPLPTVSATNITTCATGAVALTGGSPAGGTYSIPNPYSGPTTTFTYTYTNANGCPKTSATFTFTRNTAPAITAQPSTATQTVCQGDSFFAVAITATGSGTVTYQWYSNTVQSTTGGTPLTTAAHIANGSKTASYTPLSGTIGTLYYYVIVTNSCGSIKSANATGAFTVAPPSVAGTVSAGHTICAGSNPDDLVLSGQSGSVIKWQKALDAAFSTGVQDIASTATTLTGTTIGAITQTTYFRALVQNGSCTAVATAPIEVLVKSTTWTGTWSNGTPDLLTSAIFAADYNSTGDLEACSVVVSSGNVVFNANHTLTIQNGLTVSGGTLTFENDASLVQIGNTTNVGTITYKRQTTPMLRYDYTYWSSPVNAQFLATLSPNTLYDKYFWWNTAIYNWAAITAPGLTIMDIGKGYIIRAPQSFDPGTPSVFEGVFTGTPNNGNYTVPIAVSGANNLNLIGNPYPSAVDADLFMSDPANAAAIGTGTSLYFWTHNTPITSYEYAANDYATYNFSGGTGTAPAVATGINNNTPSGQIAAGQSFMIKGIANGTATFTNAMRTGSNNQFFRMHAQNLQKNRVWLELKNSHGAYKQLLVGYIEGATDAIDQGYDAEVYEAGNPVSFYSIAESKKLTIQGKGLPFDAAGIFPLGYKTTVAGNFEIALSGFDGLFAGQNVYLEDKLTNAIHDLKQGTYGFATAAGTFDGRFVLRFANTLGVAAPQMDADSIVVYKQQQQIIINAGQTEMASVKVFDLRGRLQLEKNNVNAFETVLDAPYSNGVLILQITTADHQTINRKIVN